MALLKAPRVQADRRLVGQRPVSKLPQPEPEAAETDEPKLELVSDPAAAAAPVAARLGVEPALVTAAFAEAHDTSAGRWRRDLTPEQLVDVEREAGEALVALGYELGD